MHSLVDTHADEGVPVVRGKDRQRCKVRQLMHTPDDILLGALVRPEWRAGTNAVCVAVVDLDRAQANEQDVSRVIEQILLRS